MRTLHLDVAMSHFVAHIVIALALCACAARADCSDGALSRLRAYLRLRTDHGRVGGPDYASAATFLNATVAQILPSATVRQWTYVAGKPITLITLAGTHQNLPTVLLNSHTDVVPAEADKWKAGDPFAANPRGDGRVYARGSQDMKSIGMQYLEALCALTADGWKPRRTIHVTFVPDEEVGGFDGMGALTSSAQWDSLNIGIALDEGAPSPTSQFNVYVGERQTWWAVVRVADAPGHGATLPRETATQRMHAIVGRAIAYRDEQYQRLAGGVDIGHIVGVNVAFVESGVVDKSSRAGYVVNMIPSIARAGFDIRVPPNVSPDDMDAVIRGWVNCDDCADVSVEFVNKVKIPFITPLDDEQWYARAFFDGLSNSAIAKHQLDIGVFMAATDARFVRQMKVPAIGFSPIRNTPNLLHKHDEYIEEQGYLEGINIYKALIKSFSQSATDDQIKYEL